MAKNFSISSCPQHTCRTNVLLVSVTVMIHLAEAGYLLLVTSYWLLIRLLVTDSFTGY